MVEGSGRGAYRGAEKLWWVSRVGPQIQRAGRGLASEAAALPQLCCVPACPGMQVQVFVSVETRRDERSKEIDNKSKAKRVETSCSSPPGRGKLYVSVDVRARDLPRSVECARDTAAMDSGTIKSPAEMLIQERLGSGGKDRGNERHNRAGMASVTRQIAVSRDSLAVQALLFFFFLGLCLVDDCSCCWRDRQRGAVADREGKLRDK